MAKNLFFYFIMSKKGYLLVYRADDADFWLARNANKHKVYKFHEYFRNIFERRVFNKRVYTVYYDEYNSYNKQEQNRSFEKELNECALDGTWIVY